MSDNTTTYTYCLKITRADSTLYALTDLDIDIDYDGITYLSSLGYTPSMLETTSTLSVNNLEVGSFIQIGGFERDELTAGLFDYATAEMFILDYIAGTKVRDIGKGSLGEVQISDDEFTIEYRSLTQPFQQTIGLTYQPECGATLGDAKCGINVASYTATGALTSVTSNNVFADTSFIGTQSDSYYNYGLITMTSGLNNGLSREVKAYIDSTGTFTTMLPFPFTMAVTDTFSTYAGCDKSKAVCISKFNNVVNFRGFDTIAGQDSLYKFGGQ